jgi:hypothetical protein
MYNVIADEVRKDFRKFLFVVWKQINLPDPTPLQYDIAYQLANGPNKLCIEAFRGVGKSICDFRLCLLGTVE